MVLKFNQFLEKRGFPDCIQPYVDMVYSECEKRLDEYLSRKGKFANYRDDIVIKWSKIRQNVDEENFIKFPLEEIHIKFYITHNTSDGDYYKNVYSTGFSSMIMNKRGTSKWINSRSNILEKSILGKIGIGLSIGNKNSIEYEKSKIELKLVINHELTHMFENSKKFKKSSNIEMLMLNDLKFYDVELGSNLQGTNNQKHSKYIKFSNFPQIYNIMFMIYTFGETESRVMVSQYKNIENQIEHYQRYYKPTHTTNQIIEETLEWFEKNYTIDEYNEYYKDFGNILYKYYVSIIKDYRLYRINKFFKTENREISIFTKMKGKDMKQCLDYLNKYLNNRYEYLKRKIEKVNID